MKIVHNYNEQTIHQIRYAVRENNAKDVPLSTTALRRKLQIGFPKLYEIAGDLLDEKRNRKVSIVTSSRTRPTTPTLLIGGTLLKAAGIRLGMKVVGTADRSRRQITIGLVEQETK